MVATPVRDLCIHPVIIDTVWDLNNAHNFWNKKSPLFGVIRTQQTDLGCLPRF